MSDIRPSRLSGSENVGDYELRIVRDEDVPTITNLVIEAMGSDLFDQCLFPLSDFNFTPDQQRHNRRTWMQDLWSRQLSNASAYMLVAHPLSQPEEVAGFACWNFAEHVTTGVVADNVTAEAMGDIVPAGMSSTLYQECIDKLEGAKNEVLDASKACYHLTMLAASSKHARKGIGTMLFGWAATRADAEHALIYLEATPVSLGLYEKFGCKTVAEVKFNGGGERVIMIRQPQPAPQ